jgi:hypothetical protein
MNGNGDSQKIEEGHWEGNVSVVRAAAPRGKVCNGLEPLIVVLLPHHKGKSRKAKTLHDVEYARRGHRKRQTGAPAFLELVQKAKVERT